MTSERVQAETKSEVLSPVHNSVCHLNSFGFCHSTLSKNIKLIFYKQVTRIFTKGSCVELRRHWKNVGLTKETYSLLLAE